MGNILREITTPGLAEAVNVSISLQTVPAVHAIVLLVRMDLRMFKSQTVVQDIKAILHVFLIQDIHFVIGVPAVTISTLIWTLDHFKRCADLLENRLDTAGCPLPLSFPAKKGDMLLTGAVA